jgi:uncharacterized membrane protein
MKQTNRWMGFVIVALPLAALLGFTALSYPRITIALVAASIGLFLVSAWAARELLGTRVMAIFAALALAMGWFAEQMGSSRGWFFGRYTYTDVLGPRLGDVPFVIPLMWFALCFIGYVMAQFLLWHQPVSEGQSMPKVALTSLLAAMLVTAFDLGADPYFVFVLKAWIMQKTDGGWFGETLQGFAGWMLISFLIVLSFQRLAKTAVIAPISPHHKLAAFLPIGIYASAMVFQMLFSQPIETRAVALFAMGIPTLACAVAWWQWKEKA